MDVGGSFIGVPFNPEDSLPVPVAKVKPQLDRYFHSCPISRMLGDRCCLDSRDYFQRLVRGVGARPYRGSCASNNISVAARRSSFRMVPAHCLAEGMSPALLSWNAWRVTISS